MADGGRHNARTGKHGPRPDGPCPERTDFRVAVLQYGTAAPCAPRLELDGFGARRRHAE